MNKRTASLTQANLAAGSKSEQIRSAGFNSLSEGTFDFSGELPASIPPPKSADYSVTLLSPGLAEVQINLSYNDFGHTRSLQYKTLISELGVGQ